MEDYELFNEDTQAIIYGLQAAPVLRMLDFDYVCRRKTPSVAAMIQPTQEAAVAYHKVFWGSSEIVIP
ncbi:MAG: ATP citrate synthase, partial [Candidatus Lokiarchaeota archaeon]|nr:ATP citrate synthase [Candidatus Lokiarchaeota archaeon]